jgi:hypothetical protein
VQAGCSLPGNDAVISRGEQDFVVPVKFPDEPFKAISRYGIADLAADGYSDANGLLERLCPDEDENGRLDLAPLAGYP